MADSKPIRLGALVSGNGTNLQTLIDAILLGKLNAQIALVISNKPGVPALTRAKMAQIPFKVIEPSGFPDRESYDARLADELLKQHVELVVLAGFMRKLAPQFLDRFPGRVINLHPALLPDNPTDDSITLPDGTTGKAYRGLKVVEQALASGARWTGCTVHLATAELDKGPVLKREAVPILPGDTADTLHDRIRQIEHKILPAAVQEWSLKLKSREQV